MLERGEEKYHQYRRLMGCTIDELISWLPAASNYKPFNINQQLPNQIDFPEDGIKIVATQQKSRQIALLVIPVLSVAFIFDEKWDKLSSEKFMKRFDMYTQRGGG
jgi:hypothetical protein